MYIDSGSNRLVYQMTKINADFKLKTNGNNSVALRLSLTQIQNKFAR